MAKCSTCNGKGYRRVPVTKGGQAIVLDGVCPECYGYRTVPVGLSTRIEARSVTADGQRR